MPTHPSSGKPLSVAVIGAGMAGRTHAAGYRNVNTVYGAGLPPVRLAAIADANIELGEDAARRYGYEKALPSWEAVVEDPSIDAVSIVVGNDLHRPIAEALVAAGKHVLCEKPLAGSLADARAMTEIERTADVVTAVGYTFRRSPAIAAIRDHVRSGELGDLSLFSGRYWCDYATDPNGPLSWRFKGGPGSGALGDVGAHVIDVAEYIAGPIASVSGASLSTQIPKRPLPLGAVVGHNAAPVSDEVGEVGNEDTASFTARFESGLVGTFSLSRTAFGLPNGLSFDVVGLGGRAAFDQHRPAEYLFDDAQPEARTRGARHIIAGPQLPYFAGGYPMEAPGVGGGNAEMFTYQARAFLDQVAGVTEPLPACATFADALRTMEIIQAVVASSRNGGAVATVPPHA
ncbi:Gfo/Idh/MocA family protein [Streptomyces melanosporofaciens]|uniref:Predicted dehydrogenase n=1 Tax=Streptomyces melanosporofaciens TaxID=67327 RepID=A0A1H4YZH6_STRMJ|nr:Gfo/Idh/MocA family oxidoreductase [Streptomyces melanosporofaciens]SED22471.1 Predicted dehydrogenase [Streptomyces melanosporofaciens]